jgi:hypothetical protein
VERCFAYSFCAPSLIWGCGGAVSRGRRKGGLKLKVKERNSRELRKDTDASSGVHSRKVEDIRMKRIAPCGRRSCHNPVWQEDGLAETMCVRLYQTLHGLDWAGAKLLPSSCKAQKSWHNICISWPRTRGESCRPPRRDMLYAALECAPQNVPIFGG